jgi:hypothetical protein
MLTSTDRSMTVGREEGVSKTTEEDEEEERVYQRPMVCHREEGWEERKRGEGKVAGKRGRRRRTFPDSSTSGTSQANWSRVLMESRGTVAARRGRGREAGEGFLEREASASLSLKLIAKAGNGEEVVEREDVRTDGVCFGRR